MDLRNVGILPQYRTASQIRRSRLETWTKIKFMFNFEHITSHSDQSRALEDQPTDRQSQKQRPIYAFFVQSA